MRQMRAESKRRNSKDCGDHRNASFRPDIEGLLTCRRPLSSLSMKKALITGNGQDGTYLAEFLLAKGYQVHGIKRRSSSFNTERIDHLDRPASCRHPDALIDGNDRGVYGQQQAVHG